VNSHLYPRAPLSSNFIKLVVHLENGDLGLKKQARRVDDKR
jgi:hypothetical protein